MADAIPAGDLQSLVVDGVIAGVGSVLVFLPQIAILFLFIGILEDTGYMARAAFIMDRFMRSVGLHGRSFIPMLSGYACAVPGIMATRTIESRKDRLATIMVLPLMSCSARIPIYTLLIGTFIPPIAVAGVFNLQGLTLLAMYLLGTVTALVVASLFKRTLLKGQARPMIMELPPYRLPRPQQPGALGGPPGEPVPQEGGDHHPGALHPAVGAGDVSQDGHGAGDERPAGAGGAARQQRPGPRRARRGAAGGAAGVRLEDRRGHPELVRRARGVRRHDGHHLRRGLGRERRSP